MTKPLEWTLAKWNPPNAPDVLRTELEHRVAFLARQQDFECLILGKFGMSAQTIASRTGLSVGQVTYRLHKAGIRIQDFRRGHGQYARMVFDGLSRRAARSVTEEIRVIEMGKDHG